MTIRLDNVSNKIKQYSIDPANPSAETAWVLRSGTGTGTSTTTSGSPIGLLLCLTYAESITTSGSAYSYQFSYRTKEGTTERVALT